MLTAFQQRHLKVGCLQDFDQSRFQSRDLHAIADATNQSEEVDLCANMLQKSADEVWSTFRISQQVFPKILIGLLFSKLDRLGFCVSAKDEPQSNKIRTLSTSPRRSIRSIKACLLLPILPRRKTISGT